MQVQAHYDPDQDRILLRLRGGSPSEGATLWLTRRQWTAIAVACDRARSAPVTDDDRSEPRRNPAAALKTGRNPPRERQAAAAEAKLVVGIRVRRNPGALRIEFSTDAPVPLVLALKGSGLDTFAEMVGRLARQAKWDLDAAMSRVAEAAAAPKPMLH